ncbi:hypothetical protein PV10_01643 [Exophiala mesophila]|uniref:Uncharacterized protein n=2 Tax=Exophiala mesophila TaxID=212818 RepID=A0A0D1ZTS1_EXOME|nr:uncharacterized protein PV10_01643 [Exophiala mesophila]KIV97947.1 hypothetical protein PV10_01643 [Exophiala mesophila]
MIPTPEPRRLRLITVIAATVTALACGTNYGYSVWGPSFAARLRLSATHSNLIGTFGNLGMYATGIPAGIMIDAKSPRWGVVLGIVLFFLGYYPIAQAYSAGPGAYSVASICVFSFFTGAGSCSAFTASIKAAALSFPDSRGTATAFPLAAFGLSALFFTTIALALPPGVNSFLVLLAVGTVVLPLFSLPFMRVPNQHNYHHISQHENQALHRTSPSIGRPSYNNSSEPGALNNHHRQTAHSQPTSSRPPTNPEPPSTENSSLLSRSSSEEDFGDLENSKHSESDRAHEPPHLDIRGFALLPLAEFWQLFCMLGLLTGIGLMTINNIGNDAQALWLHYDPSTPVSFIESRQAMHVSILSFCSFSGRLLSGIGSDILVARLSRSRFWCLFVSAVIFVAAQVTATQVSNPHLLILVSGLTGLAYGMLFGVYPSLVAHSFGVHGLSQNWGTMTLAPVISGNVFNLLYGSIYDAHSVVNDQGHMECSQGRRCYAGAYSVAMAASIVSVGFCLWAIRHEDLVYRRRQLDMGSGRDRRGRSSHGDDGYHERLA